MFYFQFIFVKDIRSKLNQAKQIQCYMSTDVENCFHKNKDCVSVVSLSMRALKYQEDKWICRLGTYYRQASLRRFQSARVHKTRHPSSDLNLRLFDLPHFNARQTTTFYQMYSKPASLSAEGAQYNFVIGSFYSRAATYP